MHVIPCTLPILHMSKCTFIIWLAPRMGKMNQITRCDWLPEWARWRLPAVSRKKNFLSKQKWNLCFYVAKSFILVVANSFFENWNLYQSSHCMQFTLSLQFFEQVKFLCSGTCRQVTCLICVHFLSKNVTFWLYLAQIICSLTPVLLDRKQ